MSPERATESSTLCPTARSEGLVDVCKEAGNHETPDCCLPAQAPGLPRGDPQTAEAWQVKGPDNLDKVMSPPDSPKRSPTGHEI